MFLLFLPIFFILLEFYFNEFKIYLNHLIYIKVKFLWVINFFIHFMTLINLKFQNSQTIFTIPINYIIIFLNLFYLIYHYQPNSLKFFNFLFIIMQYFFIIYFQLFNLITNFQFIQLPNFNLKLYQDLKFSYYHLTLNVLS